jgi:hypothetical protein
LSKHLTAGEGGTVTTNSFELYEKLDALRNCGRRPEPETEVTFLPDSDHLIYEGKSYSIDAFKDHFPELSAVADNHPSLGNASKADFGTEFPQKPTKGDLFLRTDYLPSKQFKWNGSKWIEVDKNITDALAYNEQYIQHLVDKLSTGEYELDDLTDTEQSQVAEYLKNSTK